MSDIVAGLLTSLEDGDLLVITRDDPDAAELARALAAGAPDAVVVFCPGSDALPGDSAPPSPANVGQRATALRRVRAALSGAERPTIALVTTGEAVTRLYPRPEEFDAAPPILRDGQEIEVEAFAAILADSGYVLDDRVDEPGEMAVRGQVIDLYPADAGEPYRIEVQDGRILSIRPYDPVTQLTHGECNRLEVGRASEPDLRHPVTLPDHLPGARIAVQPGAEDRRQRFLALAEDAVRRRPERAVRDVCPGERWNAALDGRDVLDPADDAGDPPPRFVERKWPLRALKTFAGQAIEAGDRVLLLGSPRDLRFLARRVTKALGSDPAPVRSWADAMAAAPGALLMMEMPLRRGFRHDGLVAITAADLLGSRAQRDIDAPSADAAQIFAMGELHVGDVVVHEDHGVCVVAGLEPLADEGDDAVVLRFANDARRMVPVAEAARIWRYGADEDAVTLDKLDGSSWEKRRRAVDVAVAETARGLIALAEERLASSAPELVPDAAAYERFVAGFPFTETADQGRAIDAVRDDLASGKPMNRLVVGDVGYGKTEVALRAAAIVALGGSQVAVAAPTTVLARQHLESFRARFHGLGITVAGLSRFTPAAEKKATLAGLADGSIHVVIGTGAVAGKAVTYHDLALTIIDEEQKFGAADKAKLRDLGAGHVLTLSATPIPRTLQSALIGLQQLSVIATPPARRQPIRTAVDTFDPQTVRTALLRERSRGGQSFVVVPRVEDIAPMAEQLGRLVPELDLLQAHGKLPAAEIDEAMVRFAAGDGDVLLATNIIESGLDVPRANTMIVWRADRFGLSQLHQLRGRVGRGARRGQIYLLTDPKAEIAAHTLARLKTLQALDRLGAGFAISARDLDLRGAGDLLSEEQTGHVKLIGVDFYQHMLEGALRTARGEPVEIWTPSLNFGVGGRISPEWIPEEDVRIGLYVRLARLGSLHELDTFEEEVTDRFGEPPEDARHLLALARLRVLARDVRIERIDAGPAAIAFTPHRQFAGDPAAAGLEESKGRLLLRETIQEPHERLTRAEAILTELVADVS
ncbi:helicase-related protein [Croceibacterium mercuriale]|uniref:helicase-related protein n=1 Tax=Croceibacterium mercuriale TaxID=1572751 RepID=UPI000AA230D5|nr:helicase-related protein [Croceibacterium mercuriale]